MNYFEQLKRYEERGLNNYKIKSIRDIEEIYEIKIDKIKGYTDLSEDRQCLFKSFFINYLNAIGLNSRMTFVPTSIHYVLEVSKLTKLDENDDCLYIFACLFYIVKTDGKKIKMRGKGREDKNNYHTCVERREKYYLRFDFKKDGNKDWLHVTGSDEWY